MAETKNIQSIRETVLDQKRGFLTCTGGSQAPLFKQDCKMLTLDRVTFGGNFTYEAECKDSSGTVFTLACLAFSFEPDRSMSVPTPTFGQ
ncbi:MAG: hypothetical protein KDK51_03675 [Deltaproteobacteria bacterium]|nr:hypothetical protein [Deltaproteobacteria bacterium]